MVEKLKVYILNFLYHSQKRTYLAFYLSTIIHIFLFIFFLLPIFLGEAEICGLIVIEPREINLQFEMDSGDFTSMSENVILNSKGNEKNSNIKNNESNSGFDIQKYKGGEWEKLVKDLESTKDLRKNFKESYDNIISDGSVPGSYIQRYRHFEDMVVKDVFPTLNTIEKDFKEDIKESEDVLSKHNERNEIIEEFRNNSSEETIRLERYSKVNKDSFNKIPLKMGDIERVKYLDSILKNKKEEQLNEFIEKFKKYDPDEGDLPLVFRDLYYKNIQRLAYNFSSDPTYFTSDYFEENLNKEDYLRNSMALSSKWKNTKTSTEILFSILDIYEIQERAISQYFQNIEIQKNLSNEDKLELRNETIRRVIAKYQDILKNKNIKNYNDIIDLYFKKNISITEYMYRTTPKSYRSKDILFERGRILWEYGIKKNELTFQNDAIKTWKKIETELENGEFKNSEVYKGLKQNLNDYQENKDRINSLIYPGNRLSKHLEEKKQREQKLLWHE